MLQLLPHFIDYLIRIPKESSIPTAWRQGVRHDSASAFIKPICTATTALSRAAGAGRREGAEQPLSRMPPPPPPPARQLKLWGQTCTALPRARPRAAGRAL